MLSCSCTEWSGEPGSWAWYPPTDFEPFGLNRRKRCCSCKELISTGDLCIKFPRVRSAYTEIEVRIKGEEYYIAPLYMCEKCSEIYLNLTDIGYCINPDENVFEALNEYWQITGFKPTDRT